MSFEPAKLDALLSEMIGGDAAIAAELRALFLASATAHVAAMSQAGSDAAWRDEALKLRGLAASFGVSNLMGLAAAAAAAAPDPAQLGRIADVIADCR